MNVDLPSDVVKEKRNSVYQEFLNQDYKFEGNCYLKDQQHSTRQCESRGLEAMVHPRAFWNIGYEDPLMVAILTRKRR